MSRRDVELLLKRVREELRAEGPDAGGYSDWVILDAMNSAIEDLGGVFPVRDVTTITTELATNEYTLEVDNLLNILKVEYDGRPITNMDLSDYLEKTVKDEGDVNYWVLWGNKVILLGAVEDAKVVQLWITRTPNLLAERGDTPETPAFADEAIIAYAVSTCYRESKDYDRANYHYSIYLRQKDSIVRRSIPQGQRTAQTKMSNSYWGTFKGTNIIHRSDENPGGR